MLTRATDSFVSLGERIDRARQAEADLLISLHADRLAEGEAEGVSVYSLGSPAEGVGPGTAALVGGPARGRLLAGTDLAGESDALAQTLVEIARRDTLPASHALAGALVAALDGAVPLLDKRPHRHGAFTVLMAADLPAVLVELGFLDNARDRERLGSADWRERTIGAMIDGVMAWESERRRASRDPDQGARQERNSLAGETATMPGSSGTMCRRAAFAMQPNITTPDLTR